MDILSLCCTSFDLVCPVLLLQMTTTTALHKQSRKVHSAECSCGNKGTKC
jgi:hypothetical protein